MLYALSVADLTMVLALVFVLARNVVKLVVERRRGLPFSRFRAKLVVALLGLTIVPSVLVLRGRRRADSQQRRSCGSASRSTTCCARRTRSAATTTASTKGRGRAGGADRPQRFPRAAVAAGNIDAVRAAIASGGDARAARPGRDLPASRQRRGAVAARGGASRRSAARARARHRRSAGRAGGGRQHRHAGARAARRRRRAGPRRRDRPRRRRQSPVGVVIASDFLSGDLALHARRITEAYEDYSQLRVLRRPLEGVYLSLFLMMTLMILVSATWTGLYLAKRITRPVQLLAAGAREIGAGRLDHRIEPETRDEFGSLVEAFNAMAGELAASQRRLERSRLDLERKNLQLDERRRYIETVLERIATGVVSVGADGADRDDQHGGPAPARARTATSSARRRRRCSRREDLRPLARLLGTDADRSTSEAAAQEIALAREGREIHLAAAATPLQGEDGALDGAVLVFDDVTPLIRTQRVAAWRDVARRLAHEIKNPLTPIQLCAERMRRHFGSAPAPARALVDECTTTIVGEVESLKALVDEFAQFARMPAPRAVPSDLNGVLDETLALYNGLFREHRDRAAVRAGAAAGAARRRADPARRDQSGRQRDRGAGRHARAAPAERRAADASSSKRSTTAPTAWCG